ncbi:hypothetical protein EYF80_044489 [Liparis tanakae]|uniref:Uncharacterized protein n=1 Tax=Liparis tanakae TaxID=230148 RepID=A0A4Z2FXP1_9TELE|nr:hypothetical protein EYF80_044489 [Liparis tanakae]
MGVWDRLRSGTGGLNSSRGTRRSADPCRDSLFLGGRHSLPRSWLGFMGGPRSGHPGGPPVCGCRLGHMGLAGERGTAARQHHRRVRRAEAPLTWREQNVSEFLRTPPPAERSGGVSLVGKLKGRHSL